MHALAHLETQGRIWLALAQLISNHAAALAPSLKDVQDVWR